MRKIEIKTMKKESGEVFYNLKFNSYDENTGKQFAHQSLSLSLDDLKRLKYVVDNSLDRCQDEKEQAEEIKEMEDKENGRN